MVSGIKQIKAGYKYFLDRKQEEKAHEIYPEESYAKLIASPDMILRWARYCLRTVGCPENPTLVENIMIELEWNPTSSYYNEENSNKTIECENVKKKKK